jgi:regulator of replication initiation timing
MTTSNETIALRESRNQAVRENRRLKAENAELRRRLDERERAVNVAHDELAGAY